LNASEPLDNFRPEAAMTTVIHPGLERPFPPQPGLSTPAWFCVRSQPKHEHIAAAHLRQEPDLEVFLPRLRFKRPTRVGPAWVTEALFPSYFFARFDWLTALRKVHHARGVRNVVHFGERWPTIPDRIIAELRAHLGDEEIHQVDPDLQPGDEVQIVGGAFEGLQAVIQRVMPGRKRVAVLMEFLGQQTTVQVDNQWVVLEKQGRKLAL
jgi:transcriptional antiterminator RfaH